MTGLSISLTALPGGDGACSVVRLAGEADATDTVLRDTLTAQATATGPGLLLIDVTALTFIDSTALHVIVDAFHAAGRNGGSLALVHPVGNVARMLELTGISQVITVYNSLDDATATAG